MAIMPEEQNLQMQVTRLLKLENTINEMCLQIPGFFFGRMDVMYNLLQN
jgi:hypothetical protein